MLHENVLMADIDVDHWRNLQSLVLESAKAKRRIIVIHEAGRIQKFVHSGKASIVRSVDRIVDPHADAERIYRDNAGSADFVAVFERRAFDSYFGEIQGTWRADEDLDTFVRRTYALMDKYPEGIVTYPGRARETLGLQWRIGASYEAVESAVRAFIAPPTSVILGVFDGDDLWTTLVLHFDASGRADVVSTVDVSRLSGTGSRVENAREAVAWVDATYGKASVALFTDREGAASFIAASNKLVAMSEIAGRGALLLERAPDALSTMMPA